MKQNSKYQSKLLMTSRSKRTGHRENSFKRKLHKNRRANLTDASPDLWKTIRLWIAALDAGQITDDTVLYLVTTENAAAGTIAGNLKTTGRNSDVALPRLEQTALTSGNQTNSLAYKSYLGKTPDERRSMVDRIFVVDGAPDISDLDESLKTEVFHATPREHQDTFLEYLEGWWFRRAVTQLQKLDKRERILSEELEAQMADLSRSISARVTPNF